MHEQSQLRVTKRIVEWALGGWIHSQVQAAIDRAHPMLRGSAGAQWRNGRSAHQLAEDIKRTSWWFLVRAAWQLSSPQDQEILEVASILLGSPYGEGLQILADAIIIAGSPSGSPEMQRAELRAANSVLGLAYRDLF